uniref:Uncharacterized protein n=1 Tax=viral metagenome TaxID=1070528 RepID=A0A6M3J706_9ZZZZ
MAEETVVSAETPPETPIETTPKEVTGDSSIDDIGKAFDAQEEAEPSEESTSPEVKQVTKTPEVVKTDKVDVDTTVKVADEVEGKPIPYNRFKEVNEKYKSSKSELEVAQADLQEAREALNDPEILSAIMRKRGYTDEAITKFIQEKGLNAPSNKEYDFGTVEGWQQYNKDQMQNMLAPLQQKLTQAEQKVLQQEAEKARDRDFSEVAKLAKDKFDMPMGEAGKDEDNPDTAIGLMMQHLDAHPEDKNLGYVKLFKTVMFGKGEKIAEELGVKKEKERLAKVKAGAMESESTVSVDALPGKDASIQEIDAYFNKHNK